MNMWTFSIFGKAEDPKSLMFNYDMDILDLKLDLIDDAEMCFHLDISSYSTYLGFCVETE